MSSSIPDSLDGLGDWLAGRLGDGHRQIVGVLLGLARDLDARLVARSVALPSELDRALSLVEAWQRGEGADDALERAGQSLDESLDNRGGPVDDPASVATTIALAIVRLATYEDHDDWPEEVVLPAAELLIRVAALDERRAVHWAAAHFSG